MRVKFYVNKTGGIAYLPILFSSYVNQQAMIVTAGYVIRKPMEQYKFTVPNAQKTILDCTDGDWVVSPYTVMINGVKAPMFDYYNTTDGVQVVVDGCIFYKAGESLCTPDSLAVLRDHDCLDLGNGWRRLT